MTSSIAKPTTTTTTTTATAVEVEEATETAAAAAVVVTIVCDNDAVWYQQKNNTRVGSKCKKKGRRE